MTRFIDPHYFNNFVDANILDDVADGQDLAVNEIVNLAETGEITLLLPCIAPGSLDTSLCHAAALSETASYHA